MHDGAILIAHLYRHFAHELTVQFGSPRLVVCEATQGSSSFVLRRFNTGKQKAFFIRHKTLLITKVEKVTTHEPRSHFGREHEALSVTDSRRGPVDDDEMLNYKMNFEHGIILAVGDPAISATRSCVKLFQLDEPA